MEAQTTGGGTPSALAARSGSQPHTVQACRIAERPKSSTARVWVRCDANVVPVEDVLAELRIPLRGRR